MICNVCGREWPDDCVCEDDGDPDFLADDDDIEQLVDGEHGVC